MTKTTAFDQMTAALAAEFAVIDAAFGERYTFHFMQTDLVLARADASA